MSYPIRYSAAGTKIVETDPAGPLVEYIDYEILKAENERLTALVESNLNSSKVAIGKADAVLHERDSLKAEVEHIKFWNEQLKAENDLLRKAGDAMERSLSFAYPDSPKIKEWNAAKEGKKP